MEKLKKIRLDIISLLLVTICSYLFGIVGSVISILFLIIYIKNSERHNLLNKILLSLCFLGIIFSLGGLFLINNMENKGIDAIGEALAYGGIFSLGRILLIIVPIIIILIDNRKFIFRKKVIMVVIMLGILIFLCFPIHYLITTTKVRENIPTVEDLEKELIQRDLKTNNTNYKLYGINNKSDKAIALSFEKNKNEKYPLYVYSIVDYPWIIYYANGDIYAVRGKYWDYYTAYNQDTGYNEEKIIWEYSLNNQIKSEKEEISIYNRKYNRFEKGNSITNESFNYYSKNKSIENSVFIEIPCIESWGSKIEKINKDNKISLGD